MASIAPQPLSQCDKERGRWMGAGRGVETHREGGGEEEGEEPERKRGGGKGGWEMGERVREREEEE